MFQLKDENFSNSRDNSFEYDILERTEGKGVDLVLNSLAGELLQASVRCLREHGRFLEIGKADLANNTALGECLCICMDVECVGVYYACCNDQGSIL